MFFRTVTSILDSRRNSKDFRGFLLTIFHVFFTTLCHISSVITVEMYVVIITTFHHCLLSVAGILLSVVVISMSLAMLEDIDHLPLSQTFKIICYGLNPM